jgi:hypothetical protein
MTESGLSFDINNPLHREAITQALAAHRDKSVTTTGFSCHFFTKYLDSKSNTKPSKIVTQLAKDGPFERKTKKIVIQKPKGAIRPAEFQRLLGYPEEFHTTLLARVRVIYDIHKLNIPRDSHGKPKTNKIVGFRSKSSVKVAAAVQQVRECEICIVTD